jgi:replication factor C subunit 2/4
LRKAINVLQNAATLYGKQVTPAGIREVAGTVPPAVLEGMVKILKTNSFDQVQKSVTVAIQDGFPASQIISQLFDFIVTSNELTSIQKGNIAEQIASADKCLNDGADEFLQLLNVLAFVMREFSVMKA